MNRSLSRTIVFALFAALGLCASAEASRPWTKALALVSSDFAAMHSVDETVSDDLALLSPDVVVSGDAVSADASPLLSADVSPVSGDMAAVVSSGDISAQSDDVEPVVIVTLDGGFFTVEAAEGQWRIEERGEKAAAIVADDRSAALTVSVVQAGKTTLREAAEYFASQFGGVGSLKKLDDIDNTGDAWEFRGASAGQPIYSQVFELDGGRFGMITILKDPDAPDVIDMFNSIRFK